jgi:hypothetical protein
MARRTNGKKASTEQASSGLDRKSAVPQVPVLEPPADSQAALTRSGTTTALTEVRRLSESRRGLSLPRARNGDVAELFARVEESGATSLTDAKLNGQIDVLRTWQNEANVRLHDLIARRTGVGSGARAFSPGMEADVIRTAKYLIGEMSRNAVDIAHAEALRNHWHASRVAATDAIRLRSEISVEALKEPLSAIAEPTLAWAYATFMLEGNSPALRQQLDTASAGNPSNVSLAYWRTRYHLIAGNYAEAVQAGRLLPANGRVQLLLAVVDPNVEAPAWVKHPANFYTYRYTLLDDEGVKATQVAMLEPLKDAATAPAAEIGLAAAECWQAWNNGNAAMEHRLYSSASAYYLDCQKAVLRFFHARYPDCPPPPSGTSPGIPDAVENALWTLAEKMLVPNAKDPGHRAVWTAFRHRYGSVGLEELYEQDWVRPTVAPEQYRFYADPATIVSAIGENTRKLQEKLDTPLLTLGLVLSTLALAEAHRQRRDFDTALQYCRSALRRHDKYKVLCEHVERPFVKILIGQILLEKGDSEYKARTTSTVAGAQRYQGLAAAGTYQGVLTHFQEQGEYVKRVQDAAENIAKEVAGLLQHSFHPALVADAAAGRVPGLLTISQRMELQVLGQGMPLETVELRIPSLNAPDHTVSPYASLLAFRPPGVAVALRETNPLIYSLVAQAQARLLQMESGLNYLGYRDDYVPPWRFQFLLARARYFADHAKSAESEYLNFLANAEREAYQELSVSQSVAAEKSNIRIETARVQQVQAELEVAQQSKELADLTQRNAQARIQNYEQFDKRMNRLGDSLSAQSGFSGIFAALLGGIAGAFTFGVGAAAVGAVVGAAGGLIGGAQGAMRQSTEQMMASEQRGLELLNLRLAMAEATQAGLVANAQVATAQAGIVVAALLRASAILRHEFAVESLNYMHNRTMNAEMWFRLGSMKLAIRDTYQRYAVELAFLAEQAYEFEADKQMNVIRFDYDVNETGRMLAADFLLADLDTLEQDLIVTQRLRQQQVKFVVSLAREFPAAMTELRQAGSTIFVIPLSLLERRFPGLFNIRTGRLEVTPIALMDPTRFSMEVTYMGASQVRLKGNGQPPLGRPATLEDHWPVRVRVGETQAAVYSGMTFAERDAVFPFVAQSQRGAFEDLGAAAAWQVDMALRDNQIYPGTLADILFSFSLYGYHDPALRSALTASTQVAARPVSHWLTARERFPDAFYEFNRSGKMTWAISRRFLSPQEIVGAVRNIGVLLVPAARRPEFGRITCTHRVEFDVDAMGAVTLRSEVPRLRFTSMALKLSAAVRGLTKGATATWDFGDGSANTAGQKVMHEYAQPGSYEVLLRVTTPARRMFEFRAWISVSRRVPALGTPLVVYPVLVGSVVAGKVQVRARVPRSRGSTLSIFQMGAEPPVTGRMGSWTLEPGRHVLTVTSIRNLTARFHCNQRAVPGDPVDVRLLRLWTNRAFNAETDVEEAPAGGRNAFTNLLFGGAEELSPVDNWTIELRPGENPMLQVATPSDSRVLDLREIEDAILGLDYMVTPT